MTEIADIRAALRHRIRYCNLGTFAREIGIGSAAIESFAFGKSMLSPSALQTLAAHLGTSTDKGEVRC